MLTCRGRCHRVSRRGASGGEDGRPCRPGAACHAIRAPAAKQLASCSSCTSASCLSTRPPLPTRLPPGAFHSRPSPARVQRGRGRAAQPGAPHRHGARQARAPAPPRPPACMPGPHVGRLELCRRGSGASRPPLTSGSRALPPMRRQVGARRRLRLPAGRGGGARGGQRGNEWLLADGRMPAPGLAGGSACVASSSAARHIACWAHHAPAAAAAPPQQALPAHEAARLARLSAKAEAMPAPTFLGYKVGAGTPARTMWVCRAWPQGWRASAHLPC